MVPPGAAAASAGRRTLMATLKTAPARAAVELNESVDLAYQPLQLPLVTGQADRPQVVAVVRGAFPAARNPVLDIRTEAHDSPMGR